MKTSFFVAVILFGLGYLIGSLFPGRTTNVLVETNNYLIEPVSSIGDPGFRADKFEYDVTSLIQEQDFVLAIGLLFSARTFEISKSSPNRFFAVQAQLDVGDEFELLGTAVIFNKQRDWVLPGTELGSRSKLWRYLSRIFAEKYNLAVLRRGKNVRAVSPELEN